MTPLTAADLLDLDLIPDAVPVLTAGDVDLDAVPMLNLDDCD